MVKKLTSLCVPFPSNMIPNLFTLYFPFYDKHVFINTDLFKTFIYITLILQEKNENAKGVGQLIFLVLVLGLKGHYIDATFLISRF